jgi:hypothetical protein
MPCRASHERLADTPLLVVLFYSEEKCNSSSEIITMVQTAEPGHRYDLAASHGIRPCFATSWRTLREREMRAVVMIVADVLFQ